MELIVNYIVWICSVIFSLYKLYEFGKGVPDNPELSEFFAPGWKLLERKRDISDYEWGIWKDYAVDILPWILAHISIAEVLKHESTKTRICYCSISFGYIINRLGLLSLLILLIQPVIYFIIAKSKRNIWILTGFFILFVNYTKYTFHRWQSMDDMSEYITLAGMLWIQLRCISYSVEKVGSSNLSLLDLLSYCFYLPVLFLGPVILYNDFEKSFTHPPKSFTDRLRDFSINLIRFIGSFFILELLEHYLYFNALQINPKIVEMMPYWCLYGGGLWMGLHFFLKYVIVYGISGSLSALDNIEPHSPPICIARVHLYSDMWKYFDVGLHKFLKRYMYIPLLKNLEGLKFMPRIIKKLVASLICFVYIYIWHGLYYFIFVWALLNYIGIVTESVGVAITETSHFKNVLNNIFKSGENRNRFYAFMIVPILIMSSLSFIYFCATDEIGDIFVYKIFTQPFTNFVCMYYIIYCSSRVSQSLQSLRVQKIMF